MEKVFRVKINCILLNAGKNGLEIEKNKFLDDSSWRQMLLSMGCFSVFYV